jgi:hypothetical protein
MNFSVANRGVLSTAVALDGKRTVARRPLIDGLARLNRTRTCALSVSKPGNI